MRRAPLILILLLAAFLTSGFSIKEWKASLNYQVKNEAEKSFSELFRRPVSIREAGGAIVGQIILKDVSVAALGKASQVILDFNPFSYAYHRGDIIPALSKITVIAADFDVIRDKDGQWNILSLFSPDKGSAKPPPPFRGQIIVKKSRGRLDLNLIRYDITEISGNIDLRKNDKVNFALSGKSPETVKVAGAFNAKTGQLSVNLSGKQVNARFQMKPSGLLLSASFLNLNLTDLAKNSPGIEGRASGSCELAGPITDLRGKISAKLDHTLIFGHPMDKITAAFRIKNNNFTLDNFHASSPTAFLDSQGTVRKDLTFNLRTEAAGLRLSGASLLGKMQVTVKKFKGSIGGQINPEFIASPLKKLSASGEVVLINGQVGEQPFDLAHGQIAIGNGLISIKDTYVQKDNSVLQISGQTGIGHPTNLKVVNSAASIEVIVTGAISREIRLKVEGIVDLGPLQSLTKKWGTLDGKLGIAANISGTADDPLIAASFWIDPFRFNEIYFDTISGAGYYRRNKIASLKPLLFRDGNNLYALTGGAEMPDAIDLAIKVEQVNLASAYRLFEKIRGKIINWLSTSAGRVTPIPPPQTIALNQADSLLYSSQSQNYLLKTWKAIQAESEKRSKNIPEENIEGALTGDLRLKGKLDNLNGNFSAAVTEGVYKNVTFDKLSVAGNMKGHSITIEKAVLTKEQGQLTVRGSYQFNGLTDLSVTAANMPLAAFNFFLPAKELKGTFNLSAEVNGPINDPDFNLAANCRNIRAAGIDFDNINLALARTDGTLYFKDFSLRQGDALSRVSGSFSRRGSLDLGLRLNGNAVGLINLLTEDVKWIKGTAAVSAEVKGTLARPQINGNVSLSEGVVYLRPLESNLQNLKGSASFSDNRLKIKALTGAWVGNKTRNLPNALGLAGTITFTDRAADFNLTFSPTYLTLAFPNSYSGGLYIDRLALRGLLTFDLSELPLLSGKVRAENAVITMQAGGENKLPPLKLDIEADINKNVYAVMGNITTLDLSNIFMDLEIAGQGFKIERYLSSPALLGKISIKRGTINIFNREFTLLREDLQKKFYPYAAEGTRDNTATFIGEEGPSGVMPTINLSAFTEVENQEKDPGGTYVKKKVAVLARLQGIMGATEQNRGIKIYLQGFTEDKNKVPSEMVPAAYSEQDLRVMLLPDFIKSMAGIGKPGETNAVNTNVIVADYVSSRLQALLFRGLERGLEQSLGLESLTLEYNLGPKLKEAMGIQGEQKTAWSVGFVKGFFDRLYIDVRYAQGIEQSTGAGARNTFNYQLTYKLSPIWSIIYYREPLSLQEISAGAQKITLKAGFALW